MHPNARPTARRRHCDWPPPHGAYYRRMCARLDRAKAITATAHKRARLIYTMLTQGMEYTDQGQDYDEERYHQRVMHHLTKRAEKLGFQLTPISATA